MAYVKIAEKISKTIKIQNNQKDKIKIMLKYVGNSDLIISDAIVTNEKLECISDSLNLRKLD